MSINLKTIILLASLACAMSTDFNSDSYIRQPASTKLSQLWTEISADQTSAQYPSGLKLAGLFLESMTPTMNNPGDEMPNREKLIHSAGNTAQIEFVAEPNSPYTGMFRGAKAGLIRLSLASKPDFTKTKAAEANENFIPGFGLKLIRDSLPSANLVAMFGLSGIPSWNFFAKDFQNHIGGPSGLAQNLVAKKFSQGSKFVQTVGLKDMAEFDQSGKKEVDMKFPWKLIFRAPDALKKAFPDNFVMEYTQQLKTIKTGSVLYEVYAIEDPSQACETKIGTINLKSQLITSMWADKHLFFRHGKMDDDLLMRPKWTEYTPSIDKKQSDETPEGGCPFRKLFVNE